jgi:hypothetical protein
MPLISCEDCGRDVSTSAPACPNCGRPMDVPLEPLSLAWDGHNISVNRGRDETFALCLDAAKATGLKYAVGPNGISIAGKMWSHNSAQIGLVISPVTATSTNVSLQDETGHFGPGFGSLSRDVKAALNSVAAKRGTA